MYVHIVYECSSVIKNGKIMCMTHYFCTLSQYGNSQYVQAPKHWRRKLLIQMERRHDISWSISWERTGSQSLGMVKFAWNYLMKWKKKTVSLYTLHIQNGKQFVCWISSISSLLTALIQIQVINCLRQKSLVCLMNMHALLHSISALGWPFCL